MKILYDYRLIQKFYPRGVSRYGISLMENFLAASSIYCYDNEYTLLIDPEVTTEFFKHERDLKFITVETLNNYSKQFDLFFNTSTIVMGLPVINSIDYLYPEIIIKNCKKIACILHDFVPLLIKEHLPDNLSKINYALQLEAVKKCDYIFTNSEFTSKSGSKYLELPIERFTTIYGPINNIFYKDVNYYSASDRNNTVISVLGECPRKNAERLVKAWCIAVKKHFVPEDACLYIMSYYNSRERLYKICREEGISLKYIKVFDFIPDNKLVSLLAKSRAAIFPPYLEGLGLPILESYAAGTPCFTANTSSTKELVNAEASFNPFDEHDIADAIFKIYNDEVLCKANLKFGRDLLKEINGEKIARKILEKIHAEN